MATKKNINNEINTNEDNVLTEKKTTKIRHGVVANCIKLHIRKNPDKDSEIVGIVSAGDECIIGKLNNGFYPVEFKGKQSGFCMKEFIKVL